MAKISKRKINIQEAEELLEYIISNNRSLQTIGKKTTAIELVGESGIGKTSVILQLAQRLNMQCVKLNLSQLEELGDLIGYPLKEYEMVLEEETRWVPEDIMAAFSLKGYVITGEHRMGYSLPAWLPKEESPNGIILLLDDYSRADPRFIQATMELIDRGQYISWSLPKNSTIIMSSNPDNGDYSVSSLDNAQKTRYVSIDIEFDIKIWAKWAEENQLDSRLINFSLTYPEIFKHENGVQTVNARSFETFANTISGFKKFEDRNTLANILNIAAGCFTGKNNIVGELFTIFIANNLDKLVTPEELLTMKWDKLVSELDKYLYNEDQYRADIASTLSTRFLNYIEYYFKQDDCKSDVVIKRILEFIDSPKLYLTEDLIFHLIKSLTTRYPQRTNKLLTNPKVMMRLL